MIEIIKKYFLFGIIVVLVILLFISRCSHPNPKPDIVIKRDTVWIVKEGSGTSVPRVVDSIPYPVDKLIKETKYVPDTNYPKLLKQYKELVSLYLRTVVLKDTVKLDTVANVYITDYVSENKIFDRKYTYDFKYPFVKETITKTVARNQLYIGGALQGNFTNPISQISAGLMLKNKKDQLFGAYAGMDMNGQLQLGVQSYWKIHIGK